MSFCIISCVLLCVCVIFVRAAFVRIKLMMMMMIKVANFRRSVELVLSSNASVNIYGFAGGTNFGLWNGATEDAGGTDVASASVVRQAVMKRRRKHGSAPRHAGARQRHTAAENVVSAIAATADAQQTAVARTFSAVVHYK